MLNLNGHLHESPRTIREVSAPGAAVSDQRNSLTGNETITFMKASAPAGNAANNSDDEFWDSIWAVVPDTELDLLHRS